MKGQGGGSVPCKNRQWKVKTAWGHGQSLQPSVTEMICIKRDASRSSSLLRAVPLSYYHTVYFLTCHVFFLFFFSPPSSFFFFFFLTSPNVVYFKFLSSTLNSGKAVSYICSADYWTHLLLRVFQQQSVVFCAVRGITALWYLSTFFKIFSPLWGRICF